MSRSGSAGSGGAGLPSTVVTKTANYTAAAGEFVLANAVGGAFTVTLPAGTAGQLVTVKKVDTSANAVTVAPPATGTIDGDAAGASITSPQFGAIFECTAPNTWKVVAPTSAGGSSGIDGNPGAAGASGGTFVVNAGNLGAAYTLDCSGHADVLLRGTLNANCTITPTNMVAGQAITIEATQDATGSRTLAFSPVALKPGGSALGLSTAPGSLDVISVWSPDGTALRALLAGKALA